MNNNLIKKINDIYDANYIDYVINYIDYVINTTYEYYNSSEIRNDNITFYELRCNKGLNIKLDDLEKIIAKYDLDKKLKKQLNKEKVNKI